METAIVIGAGMVGLSTAWHLQEHGVEVTVIDRTGVAAGASWGNAGYLAPAKTIPLADPSVWTYGPRALIDPDAAVHVPLRWDPELVGFLARFIAHGTMRAWHRTMAALAPINAIALEAFDELAGGGVGAPTHEGPFVIGFTDQAQGAKYLDEVRRVRGHGLEVEVTRLDAADTGTLIETPALTTLIDTAETFEGTSAKTSGAGGGDCGIVLAEPWVNPEDIYTAWRDHGIQPLPLTVTQLGAGRKE